MSNKAAKASSLTPEQELARRSRRSFVALGAGAVAGFAGLGWLNAGPMAGGDIPPALRGMLGFNEKVVRNVLYENGHLAKTFPPSAAGQIKVNGDVGIEDDLDPAGWALEVVPAGLAQPAVKLTMDDVRKLPRYEEIIDFKCVEGWST